MMKGKTNNIVLFEKEEEKNQSCWCEQSFLNKSVFIFSCTTVLDPSALLTPHFAPVVFSL